MYFEVYFLSMNPNVLAPLKFLFSNSYYHETIHLPFIYLTFFHKLFMNSR
jgi:hypothetical protein